MPRNETSIKGVFWSRNMPNALPVLKVWVKRKNPVAGNDSRYNNKSRTKNLLN